MFVSSLNSGKKNIWFATLLLFIITSNLLSCRKDMACDPCVEANQPPVAIAGPDQSIVLPINSVILNGTASTDPDNNISAYLWTKISGPSAFTIASVNSSQTQVTFLVDGIYQFELKVTDAGGLFDVDTILVTVVNPVVNHPPVAVAGADQSITLPLNYATLSGMASTDADNNITAYQWTKISGPTTSVFSDPYGVLTQITNLSAGIYGVELKVTDATGLSSKDTVIITVNPPVNLAPVAMAGPDRVIGLPSNAALLDGSASFDPNNNLTGYLWTRISGPSTAPIISPDASQTQVTSLVEGIYTFELKVTDAGGLSARDSVRVFVVAAPAGNVNFYFPDPTGSIPPSTLYFSEPDKLVIVKINNFPNGNIYGVWSNGIAPRCPINLDYLADPEMYTSFNLPVGTYTWTAETVVNSFSGFPSLPGGFVAFMGVPHTKQGTITVPAGTTCLNIPINF